jgi:serine/threonine-protein kinase
MKTCPTCQTVYPGEFTVCPRDGAPLQMATELSTGALVRGRYQILSRLGEGGMGVVYKVRHVHFDETFAIKVVNPSPGADGAEFLRRFRTEALLMRKLDHPHAVHVHDFDETEDGRPFMVMEYVEGVSLDRLMAEEPLFDVRRALRITMQVCEALAAAHHLGIIHRDIKPSNILVTRRPDGTDHVKVLDFGVAKVKETGETPAAAVTRTGFVVGTPDYMSPEQAQGLRGSHLDGRTDLYSLGVVLFHLITGRLPFTADTPVMMLMAHVQKPPPDPRTFREIPGPLASLILRALAKEPALRFGSAEEMRGALKALLELEEMSISGTIRVMPRRAPTAEQARVPEPPAPPPPAARAEIVEPLPQPTVAAPQPTLRVTHPQPAVAPEPRTGVASHPPESAPRSAIRPLLIGVVALAVLGGSYVVWTRFVAAPSGQVAQSQPQPQAQAPASGPSAQPAEEAAPPAAPAEATRQPAATPSRKEPPTRTMVRTPPEEKPAESKPAVIEKAAPAKSAPAETPAEAKPAPPPAPPRPTAAELQARAQNAYEEGLRYERGQGVPRDEAEAAKRFRAAADLGHPAAQGMLGLYYYEGRGGLPRDFAEAANFFRQAAEKGDGRGMNGIGLLYFTGRGGLAKDEATAVKWIRRAADQGYSIAQNNLGTMTESGRGTPQDLVAAHMWYALAAAAGNAEAAQNRDRLARRLTPEQIAEARARADEWKEKNRPQ